MQNLLSCSSGKWPDLPGLLLVCCQGCIQAVSNPDADTFLKATHVVRNRHAHQVTASSLYILKKAYTIYVASQEPDQQTDKLCVHIIYVQCSPCYSAVSALLTNPLPDCLADFEISFNQ